MFRTARSKFDIGEILRKVKRVLDVNFLTYRRLFILLLSVCVIFYILPPIFRYLFLSSPEKKDALEQCYDDRLNPYYLPNIEFDANIRHVPSLSPLASLSSSSGDRNFIPYIGNGYIGLEISSEAYLNIKYGRTMQLQIQFQPIISISTHWEGTSREATVTEYLTGIVHRFQCFPNYFVTYQYYAHRKHTSILMQRIKLTNIRNVLQEVELVLPRINLQNQRTRTMQFGVPQQTYGFKEFDIITGHAALRAGDTASIIVVCIVKPQITRVIEMKKRGNMVMEIPIAVHYSKPVHHQQQQNKLQEIAADTENKAIQAMTKVLQKLQPKSTDNMLNSQTYRQEHIDIWLDLWATGFTISTSKAENSLNGDRINATMYAVLSQARSYECEDYPSDGTPDRQDIAKALTYAEGCYDSYHTLQAENLWIGMDTIQNLNSLVSSWMLTLEKQGCHNLIRAGASGVIQAMVLSFGSFRFSNQHLECNMHPKDLHRDFHFRRLNYGNKTHVNVTIHVTDDNKAVINVALDRSDRSYYACDGGCLDEPVLLTQNRYQFPVKLTEPLTAILYITEDKQHMTELHQAIHVKEVAEAPAHEQHVLTLHRHGHQLGGLPTLFWVSVCAIIIVFHIFLCKLIIKEYCEPSDKLRYRYNKP